MRRDREREQFAEWIQQEENFHLQQAQLRSEIRLKEGRAKPIDSRSRRRRQGVLPFNDQTGERDRLNGGFVSWSICNERVPFGWGFREVEFQIEARSV